MIARRLLLIGFLMALPAAIGCSDDEGGGGTATPAIACTDGGAAAANAIALTCGGPVDTATEIVDVVIGGPASGATSLRGLNFDVTYDSSKLTFVLATKDAAGPFSFAALLAASARPADPIPHVIVSIQQVAGDPDVTIAAAQEVVLLRLVFARAQGTAAFAPTPLAFDPGTSEVTPPTPPTLPAALSFAGNLMLSYQ